MAFVTSKNWSSTLTGSLIITFCTVSLEACLSYDSYGKYIYHMDAFINTLLCASDQPHVHSM